MYQYYNPNPVRTGAIDCSTRALAKALNMSWEQAYVIKSLNGFLMGNIEELRDMMDSAPDDQTRQSIQRMIQQMEQG